MEEPPSSRTIRTSQEEKLSTSLLQSNSEERGILPTFTEPHQGTADGNSLRFSFERRPTDIHRTHQGTAAGNTPSPGTAGESQLTTDKTENRQTDNNIKT